MSLTEVLLPNNLFHDPLFGVSVTYPQGWTVRNAQRWGENNHKNTVSLTPPPPSSALPSMYYQKYTDTLPPTGDTEEFFREIARSKENSRSNGGQNDYKNVPESFSFQPIAGRPAMSYYAVFTARDQVMTEHFIRILGPTGYVMFFTRGSLDEVRAIVPQLEQMAASATVP